MKLPLERNKSLLMPERNDKVEKISVGIVGAGLMGKWHAYAAQRAGGEVIAVADVDRKQSELLARNYQTAQCFENIAEMLRGKLLSVIHICTPTSTHRHLIEQFIKAGVNVFVEKPLSPTAAETIYLYDLAKEHGVKICPAHQFVFQKGTKKAKNQLKSIGELIHLEAAICSAGGANSSDNLLNSIAADILPHPLSLFQTFLERQLSMENWEIQHCRSGELRISGCLGETSLKIFISLQARPTMNIFQIRGTNGTIHLDLFHGFSYFEAGFVTKSQKILRPFNLSLKNFSAAALNLVQRSIKREMAYPGLQQLIKSFYQSIETNGETPVTEAQAVNVAVVRDMLIKEITNEVIIN